MEIRAILFDINGTLIDIETDELLEETYRAIAHFLTYQGLALHRGEVRDLYFRIMKEQFRQSLEVYPEFNVIEVWREVLRRYTTPYTNDLEPEKLRQLPTFLAEMQRGISRKRLLAFPQTLEVLTQLKARYRLAVVSDAQSAYGLPELRAVGLAEFFSPVIISGDYGFRKPDSRLFYAALTELKVNPEDAVYVGNDRFRDVFGARQIGMKTVLFCPQGNSGGSVENEPDYIIYQFSELLAAIEFFAAR